MVRVPWSERLVLTGVPGETEGSSDSDLDANQTLADHIRVRMEKSASTSSRVILGRLEVVEVEPNQLISTPDGLWFETKSYFIKKPSRVPDEYYYRSLRGCYRDRHPHGALDPYNKEDFDRRFEKLPVNRAPFALKPDLAEALREVMDRSLRVAFQLPPEVEWRWPEPGERIYHRPSDGFVPVWLEHLRSGWGPRWHNFFRHLCKYVYRCSPMQITPNGIKWMSWFLICCNQQNLQPTFKLFHQLFLLVKSGQQPLYELRFRAAECGYPDAIPKPVVHKDSLKYWNQEILLLKGLDLGYMPYIATSGVVTDFSPPVLEGEAQKQVFEFCRVMKHQLTRDSFMQYDQLHEWGCKLSLFSLLP